MKRIESKSKWDKKENICECIKVVSQKYNRMLHTLNRQFNTELLYIAFFMAY